MRIRAAEPIDLDAISAIEAAAFDAPWTREIFEQELARPIARVIVAEATDPVGAIELVGFACWWHVADEAHLLRIAVMPSRRGAGVGRSLLGDVLAQARAAACVQVDLEVGRRNTAALALYSRTGFVEVGVRRGYYEHPPDDAVLLRADLRGAEAAGTSDAS